MLMVHLILYIVRMAIIQILLILHLRVRLVTGIWRVASTIPVYSISIPLMLCSFTTSRSSITILTLLIQMCHVLTWVLWVVLLTIMPADIWQRSTWVITARRTLHQADASVSSLQVPWDGFSARRSSGSQFPRWHLSSRFVHLGVSLVTTRPRTLSDSCISPTHISRAAMA